MADPAKGLAAAFKKFDINGDGTISEEELKLVMMLLDPSLSRSELDLIFTEADLSKDGSVSLEEFTNWAAAPQGMFGMVPASAANAMSREEQAALRLQSVARGRMARKRKPEKKATEAGSSRSGGPITRAELWEGVAFDRGRMRPKVDLFELVSGFNGCKRTGLKRVCELEPGMEDLLPEQVNHLALMICSRKEALQEAEARAELSRIKEFVRDCIDAIRTDAKMSLRHFKNWTALLSSFSGVQEPVMFFQWYWFEFGLFLPTVELLETLLTSTVYNESRMQVLAGRRGVEPEELKGQLLDMPFCLRDLMQLVYNGGLCGPMQLQGSEVEAMWPTVLRHMPHLLRMRRQLRGGVATGCRWKAPERPDERKELDMEKSHLQGLEEFSVLLELLFDCDRVKCRFSSPLEMVVDMVQHARQEGRLWAEP